MRPLFPEINVNDTYYVPVTDGHVLYVEESGNRQGIPVVYCHGGPGGGSDAIYRRFYDPEVYRIILFDQRGCGRSTPHCAADINALWHNTTSDLVQDMEVIRKTLDIKNWVVAGGSWGSTLALMYAIEFPERVIGLILRGIFLARQQDVEWLFADKSGASQLFPEHYQEFKAGHEFDSVQELLESYYEQLTGDNDLVQLSAAKQFCAWEDKIAKLKPAVKQEELSGRDTIAGALLNCHYFTNNSFIYECEILSEISRVQHIPGYIIHGRYDAVCKAEAAFTLDNAWENGRLEIVPESGHSCTEPGITDALIRASAEMSEFIKLNKL
ncbi:MAG: prolyl aminopeptidase [Gammaproteobacteria bacterium]|nr:prolyl aminopeptidase [Gammaproteobacteria bacterium]